MRWVLLALCVALASSAPTSSSLSVDSLVKALTGTHGDSEPLLGSLEAFGLPPYNPLVHSSVVDYRRFAPWLSTLRNELRTIIDTATESVEHLKKDGKSPAFGWVPKFMGSLIPAPSSAAAQTLKFSTRCFDEYTATAVYTSEGAELTVTSSSPKAANADCEDFIWFFYNGLKTASFKKAETRTLKWHSKFDDDDRTFLAREGFRVAMPPSSTLETVYQLLETIELFVPAETGGPGIPMRTQEKNVKFLRDSVSYSLPKRNVTDVFLDESLIHDGDFFGVLRLDGLDPMLSYGMGADTGHTTIALRFNDTLYICESTTNSNYWPTNGIQKTEYRQWLKQAKAADYNVVHLPLSAHSRALFNSTKAREWFTTKAEGLPYGFHNMLYTWIDTKNANYPPPMTWEEHHAIVILADSLDGAVGDKMWNQAFNKRMGNAKLTGTRTVTLSNQAAAQNKTWWGVVMEPEMDGWEYTDGLSMVCDSLVCAVWKASGLFGDIADQIQCTDWTNFDAYCSHIFEDNPVLPPQCTAADPGLPFCQILGNFRMSLNFFNSRPLTAHMGETCPRGEPPLFDKPAGC